MEFDASLLIHAGAVAYIIAFLARDELHLRVLALTGSALYICYYFFFPEVPLWDAIISSSILIGANLVVLSRIVFERTTLSLSDDEKQLFDAFETLTPGQFRKVLKIASWTVAERPTELTKEGTALDKLFYVFAGSVSVTKSGKVFDLQEGNFVGEIAYILEQPPSATTIAPRGVHYVSWDADALRQLGQKHSDLGNALIALMMRDLAAKLSTSYQA
ncbi:cyclic nucleotide-binding domain-containing protein [Pontixanthobacter sp. CEM42]|uniref:cyclic nucleotide-binding domain-containing protein n=1 Tax=Pontixanthobacter sp. CEM42 TaxID=2792077 RepID=UPI001ADF754E|nr:cyclic nucleotide-binding domain-containing protein [Pontixanthobacter sp. CEM42]